MNTQLLGERKPGLVSGVFDSELEAKHAIDSLVHQGHIEPKYIDLVVPDDTRLQKKLEPDSKGIGKTLVKTHVKLGIAGMVVGFLLAAVPVLLGVTLFIGSATSSIITFAMFGLFLGLLLAGFISLRPDHDPVISRTRGAVCKGRWAVVVHTDDHEDQQRAKRTMREHAELVSQSL